LRALVVVAALMAIRPSAPFGMVSCGMSYVRSLWLIVPLTLMMVGIALGLDGFAVLSGALVGFRDNLSKSFLVVAALGLVGAALDSGTNPRTSTSRGVAAVGWVGAGFGGRTKAASSLRDRKPGQVSLNPRAGLLISSAIVAVIGVVI
jgi:hypothetical protein